eukprot:TRINITY_DN47113_c0_g1_i1.p1 TRINITY_DN47113_c0_g1~~TRINITY_DN47113_c0_g1_i1.p1  ORF type:complete len:194 (-),score=60.36 TRINITY_DN47113_c0_g1_i1:55-636(-)
MSRIPTISTTSTALLCVDLQACYYQPPITELFPNLENVVTKVLDHCRTRGLNVVHVRQEDRQSLSPWLDWWDHLHPEQVGDLGVPIPLDCAEHQRGEQVFIKNTFDGFLRTGLHDYLRMKKVKTLVVMGLITRACVLNTVMSAFNHGYQVLVLSDGCGDRDIKVHTDILASYHGYNCIVLEADTFMGLEVGKE